MCRVRLRYRLLGVLATVVLETPQRPSPVGFPGRTCMRCFFQRNATLCRRHHTLQCHSCRDCFQKTISKGPRNSCGKPGFGGTSATASSSWTEWVVRFVVFNMYLLKLIQIIWMGGYFYYYMLGNSSSNKIFLSLVALKSCIK